MGIFGQAEGVFGAEIEYAIFKHQGQCVAHIRPPGFHFAVGDLQGALGRDRHQAEIAFPVDMPALGAGRDQGHVGIVLRQGAEVLQFEVEFVVEEFDGLAGAQVLKVQIATGQFDVVHTQREGLGVRISRCWLTGW